MEKKLVLIVLVVILIVSLLFLVGGALRDDPDPDPQSFDPPALLEKMERFFDRRRPPFRVARMGVGCGRTGSVLSFSGDCGITIDTSKAKSSTFKLEGVAGQVAICFALDAEKLAECMLTGKGKSTPEEDPAKFTVTSDSAFLHLYCGKAGGGCRVTVQ